MFTLEFDERIYSFGKYEALVRVGTTDRLIISLSGVGNVAANQMGFEWRATIRRQSEGATYVIVKDTARSWFNEDDGFSQLVDFIRRLILDQHISDAVAIGLSMGAYGALVLASVLPIDRVIAMSSRACLDERGAFDGRNRSLIQKIAAGPRLSVAGLEKPSTTYVYVFSVDERNDVFHAEIFAANSAGNNTVFLAYHGDHNTGVTMTRSGTLSSTMGTILAGDLSPGTWSKLGFTAVSTDEITAIAAFHRAPRGIDAAGLAEIISHRILPCGAEAMKDLRHLWPHAPVSTGRRIGPNHLRAYLGRGWGGAQATGTWSVGKDHVLQFSIIELSQPTSVRVTLALRALVNNRQERQSILIKQGELIVFEKVVTVED
ncbi:alpha/beta hydrolase [Brevundimonas guildfordensis]|uniref:Alpha/beta hydrolase n=1 Tax=Brevundimonas guildfordensis TaxID=2762241 RepID=A0ABR8R293_9CAUL|nr:alpha/beta hydrolase [Brevundimonas guildfordensis]MBD7941572.1 alpha/beta hydrolase [Brevundimonas guildfordensis]